MAKKEDVKVNENLIRDMMRDSASSIGSVDPTTISGDASHAGAQGKDVSESELSEPPASKRDEPPTTEQKRVYSKRKKKEEAESYAERFFVNDKLRGRVTLNISGDLYDRIKRFLPVIAPNLNLTSYLNNIITDHLDQNWDEITEMYNNEINKPL